MTLYSALIFHSVVIGAAIPVFPTEYEASVLMKMPYTGLEMPLHISTSSTSQKIDTFNGMQVENASALGTMKFVWNNSERVCLWSPPAAGPTTRMQGAPQALAAAEWRPANIFPDLSTYTRVKDDETTGFHKYVAAMPHGTTGTMNDEMFFLYDSVSEKPVRWQLLARNPFADSHTDIWIFEYLSLKAGRPTEKTLLLPKDCHPRSIPVNSQLQNVMSFASFFSNEYVDIDRSFDTFLLQHGKTYAPNEHALRRKIFDQNALLVAKLNQQHDGVTRFKPNSFLDMTAAEVLSFRGGKKPRFQDSRKEWPEHYLPFVRSHEYDMLAAANLPEEFDWTTKKPAVVGPVKDQGICGSCWTFSMIGPAETMYAMQTGKQIVLPEQFLVDCTWNFVNKTVGGNSGCDGGDPGFGALEIVRKYKGKIPTAKAYGSYLSTDGFCKDTTHMETGVRITGWLQIQHRDQMGFLSAIVTKGPISVGMIVPPEMLFYDSGVFDQESCRHDAANIDHAVVCVGFGVDAQGTKYYNIRNSWSTHWGDKGYIKVVRGERDCSISSEAGYPSIAVGSADTRDSALDQQKMAEQPMILYS